MLYLRKTCCEASPKAISGRTSYLRVRLEFLRYPQVIPTFFNRYGFGPPVSFTSRSTCSWIGHPVSGLQQLTSRPIKTRFRFGCGAPHLNLASYRNSSDRSTKSTLSSLNALQLLVNTGFQVLFHSPPGVLFTFPSQYCFTIGHLEYLGLEGGPPDFLQTFSWFVVLWPHLGRCSFRIRDYYALWSQLSSCSFC